MLTATACWRSIITNHHKAVEAFSRLGWNCISVQDPDHNPALQKRKEISCWKLPPSLSDLASYQAIWKSFAGQTGQIYRSTGDRILSIKTSTASGQEEAVWLNCCTMLKIPWTTSDENADVLYLDFSKAFDNVGHALLLKTVSVWDPRKSPPMDNQFPSWSQEGNDIFAIVKHSQVKVFTDDSKLHKNTKSLANSSLLQEDLLAVPAPSTRKQRYVTLLLLKLSNDPFR